MWMSIEWVQREAILAREPKQNCERCSFEPKSRRRKSRSLASAKPAYVATIKVKFVARIGHVKKYP
jgi:hypothetical protein